ncbi:NAD(P)-binding protein [Daldinia caldariorum]|uniref:NAD(P)-binding protein n=1 Tax=Daldinia caldariorum TaxID=326644 RepID=UPI002007FFA5|nr:NAD(P)-binding protein [Daldinia caldariorum]KAI1469255.1 NAD(P)-binding protein [Daldinia caldariorum]
MDSSGLFRVDGLVAAITGGGSGIGLIMAKALAGAGARKVYILGRRREVLETAAEAHPNIIPVQCDISTKESLQSAVDFITKDVGYVNLFIANSGIIGPPASWTKGASISELRKTLFEDTSMEEFTNAFHVNVTGTLFSIFAFLELLDAGNKRALEGGFGAPTKQGSDVPSIQSQVIITSSISGFSRMYFSALAYSGSKSSLIHLTKHASTGLNVHGIRVNALAPGLFPSELASGLIGSRDPATETADDPKFIPARKFGGDDEMAGAVLYLASKAGSFCNGFILVNDGGKLSTMPSDY